MKKDRREKVLCPIHKIPMDRYEAIIGGFICDKCIKENRKSEIRFI
jgi:hypothetical protein